MNTNYNTSEVPNFKIEIVGDIKYTHSVSVKTEKAITTCTFSYRLNENDPTIRAIRTAISILNNSIYGEAGKIEIDKECNPFITRTAYARVVVSENDTYLETKGNSLARAKAESKAYATLSRVLNNFTNKIIKKLEASIDFFNQKSLEVQNHNTLYLNE